MNLQIGILCCDHVDSSLQNEYGDYQEMFANLVHTQDCNIEIKVFDLIGDDFPKNLAACDGYIITGSRFGVYEDIPWIHKAKKLVKQLYELKIPTVGICFGHQLIAESLGGKVVKEEDKGRGLGVQAWDIKSEPAWMGELTSKNLLLNACHQDQVIKMPEDSELLISSDFCPIASFQKETMLGIQGHPEFGQSYTKYLFDKHGETLTESAKTKTIDSFKYTPNSDLVGSWMVNFIKNSVPNT